MTALMLEHTARTDVGHVRKNNEDAVFGSPRVVAVADGVGGAAAGEIASPRPTLATRAARAGDRLLVCSDGLSDLVAADDLRRALATSERDACASTLIALALHAGGRDNITVVVADVVSGAAAGWA